MDQRDNLHTEEKKGPEREIDLILADKDDGKESGSLRVRRRKNRLRKRWNLRFVNVFKILAALFFILGLLLPLRPKISDLEKRELASFPAISLKSLWDGSYFTDISTWYADSYPFRETFLSLGSLMESGYGIHTQEIHGNVKTADEIPDAAVTPAPVRELTPTPAVLTPDPDDSSETTTTTPTPTPTPTEDGTLHDAPEVAGAVYIVNNRGFEIYYFNRGGAEAYASMLNTVRSTLGSNVTVYDILAPTNFSVCLDESIQESIGGSSASDAFSYINSMLDPSIKQVPVLDTLISHNAEYIYYNTDHHWTAQGAYYAYQQFCSAKGLTPHALSDYTEVAYSGFLGTFYSYSNQSEALANNPDTVYAYIPMGTNDETVTDPDGSSYSLNVINDMTDSSAGSKYSSFLGGDNALTTIHNPNLSDGSACLLIKESYGNAFAPFLVDHYENVYVVDYRYYNGNLTSFISEKGISDVIFLNNSDALSEVNSDTMLTLFQ
jgi:hypothetical protein